MEEEIRHANRGKVDDDTIWLDVTRFVWILFVSDCTPCDRNGKRLRSKHRTQEETITTKKPSMYTIWSHLHPVVRSLVLFFLFLITVTCKLIFLVFYTRVTRRQERYLCGIRIRYGWPYKTKWHKHLTKETFIKLKKRRNKRNECNGTVDLIDLPFWFLKTT